MWLREALGWALQLSRYQNAEVAGMIVVAVAIVAFWWWAVPAIEKKWWTGWGRSSGAVVTFVILIGLAVWDPYHTQGASLADWEALPKQRVIHQTFTNTTVELDGKSFEDCLFENATLMFHGRAPFAFTNVTPAGSIIIATDNKAIHNFEKAKDYMLALGPKGERWSGERDEKGTVFRYPSPKSMPQ